MHITYSRLGPLVSREGFPQEGDSKNTVSNLFGCAAGGRNHARAHRSGGYLERFFDNFPNPYTEESAQKKSRLPGEGAGGQREIKLGK